MRALLRFVRWGIYLLGVAMLLLLSIPTLISSSTTIRTLLFQCIGSFTDCTISVKALDLQWWRGITAENIAIIDSKTEKPIFLCEKIESSKPLITWALNPYDLHQITLIRPQIFLKEESANEEGALVQGETIEKSSRKSHKKTASKKATSSQPAKHTLLLPKGEVKVIDAFVQVESNGRLLRVDKCDINLLSSTNKVTCKFNGTVFADANSSLFSADISVNNPLNTVQTAATQTAATWNIDIENFPIDFLLATASPFIEPDLKPLLNSLLGETLRFQTKGTLDVQSIQTNLTLHTETLESSIGLMAKREGNTIIGIIDGNKLLTLSCKEECWVALQQLIPSLKPYAMNKSAQIEVLLAKTDFSIPSDESNIAILNSIPATVIVATKQPFLWTHKEAQAPIQADFQLTLARTNELLLTSKGQLQVLSGGNRALINLTGQPPGVCNLGAFNLLVTATGDWNYFAEIIKPQLGSTIGQQPEASLSLKGVLNKNCIATLKLKNLQHAFDIDADFKKETGTYICNLKASAPAYGELRLENLLVDDNLERFSGQISTDNLKHDALSTFKMASQFTVDLADRVIAATLKAGPRDHNIENIIGALRCYFPEGFEEAKRGNFELNCNVNVEKFPVHFVPKAYRLLAGDEISSTVSLAFSGIESSHNLLKVEVKGKDLSLTSNLSLQKNREIYLTKGGTENALEIKGTLTNEFLKSFTNTITLTHPVAFTMACKKFTLPLSITNVYGVLDALETEVEVGLGETEIKKKGGEKFQVAPQLFTVEIQPGTKSADIILKGDNKCHLFVKNLWSPTAFTIDKATINFDATITNLPFEHKKLDALLGKKFSIQANGSIQPGLNGKCQLITEAKQGKASGHFLLKNGLLELESPFLFDFTPTQEVGDEVFAYMNPVLETTLYSASTIRLTIEKEGFVVPLKPFSIASCKMGKATLDLGKLRVANQGVLLDLLKLLRDKQAKLKEIDLWCTPCYFSLNNGVLNCARADFLLGSSVHISTWGSVDFNNERPNLILGIGAPTLMSALNLKSLPADYMLQLPISGTLEKPSLDLVKSTTKIAALVGAKGIETTTLNTKAGGLLGSLFVAVTQAIDLDPPPPPPTTTPFPWSK